MCLSLIILHYHCLLSHCHIKPGHDPKPGFVIAMFYADGPFTLALAGAIIGDLSGIIGKIYPLNGDFIVFFFNYKGPIWNYTGYIGNMIGKILGIYLWSPVIKHAWLGNL